jgi:hypothetical protein
MSCSARGPVAGWGNAAACRNIPLSGTPIKAENLSFRTFELPRRAISGRSGPAVDDVRTSGSGGCSAERDSLPPTQSALLYSVGDRPNLRFLLDGAVAPGKLGFSGIRASRFPLSSTRLQTPARPTPRRVALSKFAALFPALLVPPQLRYLPMDAISKLFRRASAVEHARGLPSTLRRLCSHLWAHRITHSLSLVSMRLRFVRGQTRSCGLNRAASEDDSPEFACIDHQV